MNKNSLVLLHLSLIRGVGSITILKLIKILFDDFYREQKNCGLQNIEFDLMQIYSFSNSDFKNRFGFSEKLSNLLVVGLQDKSLLNKELILIEKYKIDISTLVDDDYPLDLKEIYSPPVVLYCKGIKLKYYKRKLSIVGSRRSTPYAHRVLNHIIPDLIFNDFSIISGGAIGVDTIAHKIAVENNSKTIIVLGSGLLKPYPKCNNKFFHKVSNGAGTLVSPFPLLRESDRGTFPARNRIIAGLSSACLVVQAARKSGALITAQYALDEGRSVFAIPGSIFEPVSEGCNNLIKQGAKLVTNTNDILEEFNITNIESKKNRIVQNKKIMNQTDLILNFLEKETSIDQLSLGLNIELSVLQDKLFDLQMKGKVKQNLAGYWEVL